ncbi:MAG TPA: serine/threonine-protein kinase [Polyangia bacterium]|jgi:serine/threonine-protein kinase
MSLIGRRIGNYEIKAKIGEGGMGTVYLGEHPLIGKRVAIKVLLEELVAKQEVVSRFFNEAKAVNDIGHLNIVDVVDFGKIQGDRGEDVVYFIMEFLDGEALSSRIRRAGLPFKDTLHIIGQCCSALAASHKKGIVHRDLKPENIFLVPRGADKNFVKILDFGIAKLTGDGGTNSHKTRTGLVIGTPTYMSPEQCEGKGLIDHRSDVYSLGIMMYELLTGAVPFPGDGFGEVLVAHLTKEPPKPSTVNPNLPPAIESIVLHAIEKDRNRRFQNMDEFLAAVENPEAHAAAWSGLPAYAAKAGSAAPTMQAMDAVRPAKSKGRTLALDDAPPASLAGAPRPTTLEGAAAEVTLPPTRRPRSRSRAPLIAVTAAVAGVVALAAIGGWVGLSKKSAGNDAMATSSPPPSPAPSPSTSDEVTVTVTSDPLGAKVYRADKSEAETQPTPISFKLHRGDPPFDIQLRVEGYKPETRTIASDGSMRMMVALSKLPNVQPKIEEVAAPRPVAPPRPTSAPVSNVASPPKPAHHTHHADGPKPPPKSPKAPTADPDGIIQPDFH